jgi:hypothetical protein
MFLKEAQHYSSGREQKTGLTTKYGSSTVVECVIQFADLVPTNRHIFLDRCVSAGSRIQLQPVTPDPGTFPRVTSLRCVGPIFAGRSPLCSLPKPWMHGFCLLPAINLVFVGSEYALTCSSNTSIASQISLLAIRLAF